MVWFENAQWSFFLAKHFIIFFFPLTFSSQHVVVDRKRVLSF